jgi:hypothetical protein
LQTVGFVVPCPRFVPNPSFEFAGCQTPSTCVSLGRYIMEGDWYGPRSYHGKKYETCEPNKPRRCVYRHNRGHAFILVASPKHAREIECCNGRVVGRAPAVHRQQARWVTYAYGSGLNSKHVMIEWHDRGLTLAISVYADNPKNRRLAWLLANWLTFSY